MSTTFIRINPRAMRQPFHPCTPDFIRDVCHAACCRSTTDPTGIAVVAAPDEYEALEARGAHIDHTTGRITPTNRRCPFQNTTHTCDLHGTTAKPRGCVISPFTINPTGTLIVRNRYRLLKCYRAPGSIPVYQAHRTSLTTLFGEAGADTIATAAASDDLCDTPLHLPVPTTLVHELQRKNAHSKNA